MVGGGRLAVVEQHRRLPVRAELELDGEVDARRVGLVQHDVAGTGERRTGFEARIATRRATAFVRLTIR